MTSPANIGKINGNTHYIAKQTEEQQTHSEKVKETPQNSLVSENYVDFATIPEAMKYILDNSDPQVIAIGEYHYSEFDDGIPTIRIMSDHIVPILSQTGFNDMVLEMIPSDAAEETEYYNKAGNLNQENTPNILLNIDRTGNNSMLPGYNDVGLSNEFKHSYNSLHKNSINLHPGGYPTSFYKSESFNDNFCIDKAAIITNQLLSQTENLLKQGKKVIVYSGAAHNDINPEEVISGLRPIYPSGRMKYIEQWCSHLEHLTPKIENYSIADELVGRGYRYVELDIIEAENSKDTLFFHEDDEFENRMREGTLNLLYFINNAPLSGARLFIPKTNIFILVISSSFTKNLREKDYPLPAKVHKSITGHGSPRTKKPDYKP